MTNSIKIPTWFYVIAALAVVWNAMGVMAYINSVMISAEDFLKMPEAQQSMQKAMPSWAKAAFAVAVFAGTIGSFLLLLKKSLAMPALIVSLFAVLIQMSNFIFLMDGFNSIEQSEKIMTSMIIVVAFLLVWFANSAKTKKWIS